MRDKILNDLKAAMKSQEKEKLQVIRMVKGAIQMEELNTKKELDDNEIISIIAKQIKSRKESIVEFNKAGRTDLTTKTEAEIKILDTYMPVQLTEEEINLEINKLLETETITGMSDFGKFMGKITPILKGRADMAIVSKLIKNKINNI
ncbi:MAG: GatB/YqeY domain-containing protein [Bacilli bacterium]